MVQWGKVLHCSYYFEFQNKSPYYTLTCLIIQSYGSELNQQHRLAAPGL